MAEPLFWPALAGYGESRRSPTVRARPRLGTWGVRLGWLAQTALLGVQAARRRRLSLGGLGWLAQPLRLARRRRVPDLGLPAALPPARPRGHAARRGPARRRLRRRRRGRPATRAATRRCSSSLHVGLVLAAFAGFTLAAALSALYLWQERRLKRREAGILRSALPVARDARRRSPGGRSRSRCRRSRSASRSGWSGSEPRRRVRRADGRDPRSPGRSTAASWCCATRPAGAGAAPRTSLLAGFALVIASGSACRWPTSRERLVLVGISHRLAPVELRELVALGGEEAAELARMLAADGWEAVCLSTCNRTELYLASDDAERPSSARLAVRPGAAPFVYRLHDEAAALHLFRVAAGLDSMVPGEGEILGQVRTAYEAGAPGPLLDRLFRQALHAGKKVRSRDGDRREPRLGLVRRGRARAAGVRRPRAAGRSSSSARERSASWRRATSSSRGAEISASRTARSTARRSSRSASAASRRRSTEAQDELEEADVVVSSTSAPGFVLEPRGGRAVARRPPWPAALPDRPRRPARPRSRRSTSSTAATCTTSTTSRPSSRRRSPAGAREAARAEEIVAEEAERFRAWHASLRRRPRDRVACARGPRRSARGELARATAAVGLSEPRAPRGRVGHRPDREQAPAPADGAHEGGRGGADGRCVTSDVVRDLFGLGRTDVLRRSRLPRESGSRSRRPSSPPTRLRAARYRDRARPDHDRRRPRPHQAVRGDRRARRLRQGDRGGAAGRADRRRRPLRQGHDLLGHRRPRRRRLPRARGSARRALRRGRDPAGDADRDRVGAPARAAARARADALGRAAAGEHRHAPAQAWRARSRRGRARRMRARPARALRRDRAPVRPR